MLTKLEEARRGQCDGRTFAIASLARARGRLNDKTHSNYHGYREEHSLLTGMIHKSNRSISAFESGRGYPTGALRLNERLKKPTQ